MKKRWLLYGMLMLPALLGQAATGSTGFGEQGSNPAPRLVLPEERFDAGKVDQGAGKIEHTFVLTNAGNAPLEIYSAESS